MLTIIIIFAVLGLYIVLHNKKPAKYPPGPVSIPIFGSIPLLTGDLMQNLEKLSNKYGNIFSVQLGPQPAIILCDYGTVRQAFAQDLLSGRPSSDWANARDEGGHGIVFSDGPHLQEMRRFVLRSLRDLGMGKSSLEETVKVEVAELADFFRGTKGSPVCLRNECNVAIINALWKVCTGERFDLQDPICKSWLIDIVDTAQGTEIIHFFSPRFARLLVPEAQETFEKDQKIIKEVKTTLRKIIQEHQTTEYMEDFISAYLEQAKKSEVGSSFYGEQGIKNLVVILMDLFSAGVETTTTALTWIFLLVAMYPEVQTGIQEEIDSQLGNSLPKLEDKSKLKYTEAVISEVLRYITLTPLGVPHRAMEDSELCGFHIPKDTILMANLHSILHDPNVWKKPDEFYPDHFLGERGKKYEAFLPFSVGKRICIGESLARMELFLFVTGLLQQFEFRFPEGVSHKIELSSCSVRGPKPYSLIIEPRLVKLEA